MVFFNSEVHPPTQEKYPNEEYKKWSNKWSGSNKYFSYIPPLNSKNYNPIKIKSKEVPKCLKSKETKIKESLFKLSNAYEDIHYKNKWDRLVQSVKGKNGWGLMFDRIIDRFTYD